MVIIIIILIIIIIISIIIYFFTKSDVFNPKPIMVKSVPTLFTDLKTNINSTVNALSAINNPKTNELINALNQIADKLSPQSALLLDSFTKSLNPQNTTLSLDSKNKLLLFLKSILIVNNSVPSINNSVPSINNSVPSINNSVQNIEKFGNEIPESILLIFINYIKDLEEDIKNTTLLLSTPQIAPRIPSLLISSKNLSNIPSLLISSENLFKSPSNISYIGSNFLSINNSPSNFLSINNSPSNISYAFISSTIPSSIIQKSSFVPTIKKNTGINITSVYTIPILSNVINSTGYYYKFLHQGTNNLASSENYTDYTLTFTNTINASILVVGGGGGGGEGIGSGGGAGGLVYIPAYTFNSGLTYKFRIGAGGLGMRSSRDDEPINGTSSIIFDSTNNALITALGGARGNGQSNAYDNAQYSRNGGCGAGGVRHKTNPGLSIQKTNVSISQLSRDNCFSNDGGYGSDNGSGYGGGGGGGAGTIGKNGSADHGGDGGDAKLITITGNNEYYAAGGGGGSAGSGSYGGQGPIGTYLGGNGIGPNGTGGNAVENTGSGGGGAGNNGTGIGGNGSAGIIIIKFDLI